MLASGSAPRVDLATGTAPVAGRLPSALAMPPEYGGRAVAVQIRSEIALRLEHGPG